MFREGTWEVFSFPADQQMPLLFCKYANNLTANGKTNSRFISRLDTL